MQTWTKTILLACAVMLSLPATRPVVAAPPLTEVRDMLYKADGSTFTGMLIIEWKSFHAADASNIPTNLVQVRVSNGVLRAKLVPTTNASSNAYYAVRYITDGRVQFGETWAVPPSANPVRVRDIRVAAPPASSGGTGGGAGPQTQVSITDVTGLREELDLRPVQGLNYAPSRAAFINDVGQLEAVMGNGEDCVRVDGSSGPCGGAGGFTGWVGASFVDGEIPAGAVDGLNLVFQLGQTPSPASSLLLYRNGVLQKRFLDYTLSANAVSFASNAAPQPGDLLLASYRTASAAGGGPSLVMCTGTGSATSSTSPASLASCVIPAGVLRAGDRLEIVFDYAHTGSASGFQQEIRWNTSPLHARGAASDTTLGTGRISVGIQADRAQFSAASWGVNQPLMNGIGTLAGAPSAPVTILFRGWLDGAGGDAVSVESYSVVRHPAP